MQDQLIRQLQLRLMRFRADQNPETVLASRALSDLNALLEGAGDPTVSLPIYHLAGWLHWARYIALGPADGDPDLRATVALLAPVYHVRPDMVPDPVRDFFDRGGLDISNPGPVEVARAAALAAHAERTSDLSMLNFAINLLGQPAAEDQASHLEHRTLLASLLRIRYELTGAEDDLTAAIAIGQDIIAAMRRGQPNYAACLSEFGLALRLRSERTGIPADLDSAIDILRQAVAENSNNPHPGHLSNLGNALNLRFQRTGTLADLDAAIDLLLQAADHTPTSRTDHAGYKTNLAGALIRRFERTGDEEDLKAAIVAGREAVAAAPIGHPARPLFLSNLCATLRLRFVWTGDLEDLNGAVDAGQQAVEAAPAGHPNRAMYLHSLCGVLRHRFERAENIDDLNAAISAGLAAVDATARVACPTSVARSRPGSCEPARGPISTRRSVSAVRRSMPPPVTIPTGPSTSRT
jgi:tetratricopeptide (TPR) repeat protein